MNPERKLLKKIAGGDRAALAELYRRYYFRVARFVIGLVNEEAVGEIVNDVFMVVWQKAVAFREDASPSTWILGIAYKKAIKWSSRQPEFDRYFDHYEDDVPAVTSAESLVELDDMGKILARLPPEQRAVIELTYVFGYSYSEIGEVLDCPENTVKTRMFHARRKLKLIKTRLTK